MSGAALWAMFGGDTPKVESSDPNVEVLPANWPDRFEHGDYHARQSWEGYWTVWDPEGRVLGQYDTAERAITAINQDISYINPNNGNW